MQLTSKFDLGQQVWWIRRANPQIWTPCAFCGASGYITGANGVRQTCPECYNRKGKSEYKPAEWLVQGSGHVGQIKAIVHDHKYTQDNPEDDDVEYMLRETGLGCGSYYHEVELFATEKEAQAVCDERNKEEAQ